MTELLWLIPAAPIAGFLALALAGSRFSPRSAARIGVASVGASAIVSWAIAVAFVTGPPAPGGLTQTLWTWLRVDTLAVTFTLRLDGLSLAMALVVTTVGLLIHVYSVEHLRGAEGYRRFFAAMNLFVAAMLVLVLADDLLVLYLGWEGVGLCSYLLIGFWYRDPANGRAARKAFVITRVGDAALAVGLLLIFDSLGTLGIPAVATRAAQLWPPGSAIAVAVAALLLAGAAGKSAQLPLQTWLPDAMAGPAPVSALLHAATMVTAGVYLVARLHPLFLLAPPVLHAVAVVGALTLLVAGSSALVQRDLKRALAYSTMSQVGSMFLALGVGGWAAAVFHLATHAFCKSLLFLGAGAVIAALGGEHDLAKMGGLRRRMPLVFWTFLAGAASLAALPLVTAGFYSKDAMLQATWASAWGGGWLTAAFLAGALLTGVYAFRVVLLVFAGEPRSAVGTPAAPGLAVSLPLVTLAVLSVGGALVALPGLGGGVVSAVFPAAPAATAAAASSAPVLSAAAVLASVGGAWLAWLLFGPGRVAEPAATGATWLEPVRRFLAAGWGFDAAYDRLLVRPFLWCVRAARDDVADLPFRGLAWYASLANLALCRTQSGHVRRYAAGIAIGAIVALGIVLLS
jgi:NADH-quinone oxidoreductase subunit L